MSAPRRPSPSSSEDNILARLERVGRNGAARPSWKRSWIAWCGVASFAIIGMIGLLASLARENVLVHQSAVLAELKASPDHDPDPYGARAPVVADIVAGISAGFAPLPAPAALPAPMPAPAPTSASLPAQPSPVVQKPAPVRAIAATPAALTPRKSAPVVAVKPAPKRTLAASAPRQKKSSPAPARARAMAAAPDPAVDSDVALLSAIIMHSNRHAGERAQLEAARCSSGKKCAPAAGPLTSLDATD